MLSRLCRQRTGAQASGAEGAGDGYLPRNEAGQIKAQTVDLLYAAEEPTMRADFENKDVEVIGQFMPARANNPEGDRFNLVRMFVICCAADARPVAISVQMDKVQPTARDELGKSHWQGRFSGRKRTKSSARGCKKRHALRSP